MSNARLLIPMKKAQISVWFFRVIAVAVAGLAMVRAQVEGPNGHYYKVVMEPSLLWEEAKAHAAESTFNGVHGYLATITSAEEDQFIEDLRQQAAPGGYGSLWVGGSQVGTGTLPTDSWYWVNGEGPIPTRAGGDGYSNWQPTEPNDYWGPQSEGYLSVGHFNTFGWNDEPNDRHIMGYVVEYPSKGTTSTVKVVTLDPVATESDSTAPPDVAVFVFSRTGDTSLDLPVFYSVHGTAANGADYNEIAKSIIIPAGKSEVRLEIVPKLDMLTVVEPMETVGIRIEPSQVLTPTAAYYIDQDRREAGAVIYERKAPEKTFVEIALPRTGFSYKVGEPVVILAARYSTQRVTMIDYYIDGQLLASVSDTEDTNVLNFFRLVWSDPTPGTHTVIAKAHGDTTVRNSAEVQFTVEGAPQPNQVGIRFVEPTSTEPVPFGDYARGYLEVTRTGSTPQNLQVFYTIGGTASAGADYEPLQDYVVIPAGKTTAKIVVTAIDDPIDEPNETVVLTLLGPPPQPTVPDASAVYTIDPSHSSAQVTIIDDDPPADLPVVSILAVVDHTVESGIDTPGRFRISRTGATTQSLNVSMTYDGTATAELDYRRLAATVTIPAGASSAELIVEPLNDQLVEGDETVRAVITPLRGVLYNVDSAHANATVTIRDDDTATGPTVVRIATTDAIATEGATPDPAAFEISRSGSLTESLIVFFSIHGTAKNGEDYDAIPDTVTIPAGKAAVQLKINPKSDSGGGTTHKYEIVQQGGLSWQQAREQAASKNFGGIAGHLATITSAEEDLLIDQLRVEAGSPVLWVGGFQEPSEMSITEGWKWVNNEGPISGTNDGATYANWLSGEPNDYWGAGSENAMVIGWLNSFGWNDQGANVGAAGYVVEYDTPVTSSVAEPMETVGIRLEPSATMNPLPSYDIDPAHRMAGAVIFDGPSDGALEIAIPSAAEIFQASDVEFLAEAYHPVTPIYTVDFYVDEVKVGSSSSPTGPSAGGGVIQHRFKWATPTAGQHTLQAKATLGGGRILVSSKIPFSVEGVVDTTPTVKVIASDAQATEFASNADGFDPARFVISRSGSTAQDLQVFFSLHGTAINGQDYDEIDTPIIIPAGRSSIEIEVVPLSDGGNTTTHHYEIVSEPNLSWEQARDAAEAMVFGGVKGHLATITSRAEDELIQAMREQAGSPTLWVGGYQNPEETSATEGWKWVNDEGAIPGMNGSESGYANWTPGEPNDYWGPGSENHMVVGWGGMFGWNDQTPNIPAQGYVVEFDVATPAPAELEQMETVAIRLERAPNAAYKIDEVADSAAAVIFERTPPANGAIEIAIPSSGETFNAEHVEFIAAAYHPTMDSEVVEFYVDDVKVGQSMMNFERPTMGGVFEHHFVWTTASNGAHVLQAKARLSDTLTLVSSRIPFVVNGAVNVNPIAKITKPADGAAFVEGDTIHAVATATDADGSVAKIELLLDGAVIATAQGAAIEKDFTATVGTHTLIARATDDAGAIGMSAPVHILVRHPDAVAFVHRELPAGYSPGVSFLVTLRADPPEGTFAYAVEDRPPASWRVTEVSSDGAFDAANGKVKFGPFTDDAARTLTYRVTPPASATGRYAFTGTGSVNGALYQITGDSAVELVQQFHPADTNHDLRIPLAEVTSYAAAWKAGRTWPSGPVPIPLSYVTRAHYIWQHGEAYRFDPAAGAPPACWISTASPSAALVAAAIGGAQRSVLGDLRSGAAAQVRITAAPVGGSSGYAVEEKPPRGWVVSNISHDGTFDGITGTIRWGVFADGTTRTLTYTVTPPPTVTAVGIFAGQLSFDGKVLEVTSEGGAPNSVTSSGSSQIRINDCTPTATGTTLNISGAAGQTAVIEGSSDFTDWTEVKSIFIPGGSVNCTDDTASGERRFYRVRVQ